MQSRNVTCEIVEMNEPDGSLIVDNSTEFDLSICEMYREEKRPKEIVSCNDNIICPVRFLPSAFGAVSKFCSYYRYLSLFEHLV